MDWLAQEKDTIAAIATAAGEAGIGIIRISGELALPVLKQLFKPMQPIKQWVSHKLQYGHLIDQNGQLLDQVLAVWMAKGRSYTGEDVVEIHAHGGSLNLTMLLRNVLAVGARPANPGEFTRRAFMNGRIDLTQAEAIADLISAKNQQALCIARRHLQGQLQQHIQKLADRSLSLAAQIESWIDFPEEFDPALDHAAASLIQNIREFTQEVKTLAQSYDLGQTLRQAWSILLLGPPNTGKSSLFNRLIDRDYAIVTDIPGTTRDLLQTQISLGGIQLMITDSAGLRQLLPTEQTQPSDDNQTQASELSNNTIRTPPDGVLDNCLPAKLSLANHALSHEYIEQIGMQKTLDAVQRTHLLLAVFDRSRPWSEENQQILEVCKRMPTVVILNKSDLPSQLSLSDVQQFASLYQIDISCLNGDGIASLKQWLLHYIEQQTPSQELVITNERQYHSLQQAVQHLQRATSNGYALGPEFMAEDLRAARRALASITGDISSEDVLDALFSQFCIGK